LPWHGCQRGRLEQTLAPLKTLYRLNDVSTLFMNLIFVLNSLDQHHLRVKILVYGDRVPSIIIHFFNRLFLFQGGVIGIRHSVRRRAPKLCIFLWRSLNPSLRRLFFNQTELLFAYRFTCFVPVGRSVSIFLFRDNFTARARTATAIFDRFFINFVQLNSLNLIIDRISFEISLLL